MNSWGWKNANASGIRGDIAEKAIGMSFGINKGLPHKLSAGAAWGVYGAGGLAGVGLANGIYNWARGN